MNFRRQVISDIFEFSKTDNAFELLESKYKNVKKNVLIKELIQVGIMPEIFEHDSSEEKLWSKFSDIILSVSLNYLGLTSEVLRTRGNSADVYSKTKDYSLVSDAKCFRLSRTAKNQKDFKVKSLDDWRRHDTYAMLIAPLFQYPIDRSQIYPQAILHNVSLLSYVHLQFLLEFGARGKLELLWKIPDFINSQYKGEEQKRGIMYWRAVDSLVCSISGQKENVLQNYKEKEIEVTKSIGNEGIEFWKSRIDSIKSLSKSEAINMLLKSQKIEKKIETIEKTIERIII